MTQKTIGILLLPLLIHLAHPLNADEVKNPDSALTSAEKAWIQAHPIIRLAPDPQFDPVEFFNSDGNYAGIGADYARLIAEKLGLQFKIVRCKTWNEVVARAEQRRVDVLNAVVKTPQRETYLRFPAPYLKIPTVILARNSVDQELSVEELRGIRVVMVSGYGYVDLIRNKYPNLV